MTDKGPVDGSLWIFKADQEKKPNKKVKKPSKDCNREKEKECAKQENEEEKMDESNSSEGILWQDYHDSMNVTATVMSNILLILYVQMFLRDR